MNQKTPLYEIHCSLGGQMVDFSGWQMPLNYGSQITEHHAVRRQAGMFDVSHMGVIDVCGPDAEVFLRYVLANDVKKLDKEGKALYSCLLNPRGGVIDDLIAYRLDPEFYRLVVNAGRRIVDFQWLAQLAAAYRLNLIERPELAIIAVQGPGALEKLSPLLSHDLAASVKALRPFQFLIAQDWQISRTGYTGEDGVEIILPAESAVNFWKDLLKQGIAPCGLGARDTLRLEAGLNLYGVDMTEETTPFESNLEWTIDWLDSTRNFIGREALAKIKQQGIERRLVGLIMSEPGVLRNHQPVWHQGEQIGEITSGSFSPTLGQAIAMARISGMTETASVERRGKMIAVKIVKLPFIGRSVHEHLPKRITL